MHTSYALQCFFVLGERPNLPIPLYFCGFGAIMWLIQYRWSYRREE